MGRSAMTAKLTVGVLLSGREKFSPLYGGALARWTFEVYSRLTLRLEATVFGFPTQQKDLYPLSFKTSAWSQGCRLVARVPFLRRHEDALWLWALRGHLRELQVLHVHNRPQWVPLLRRLCYRGTIVLHLHNDHVGHWSGPMLNELAKQVDAVATCSSYLRDTFAGKSPELAAKAAVVFNGANLRLFYPREELREPQTIFFVGRIIPEKGALPLLRAYGKLLSRHPKARLVIGGSSGFGTHQEGNYVRQVRELAGSIAQRGGRIEFTGYLDHDRDLPLWFQKATIFACPSVFQEPFGLVNVEAMACATPVVGAQRGGIPEVLGDTGRIVEPENSDELANALGDLLEQPNLCRELGRAGHERCRRLFDWDMIAEHWGSLLEQASAAKTIPSKVPILSP